MRPYSPAPSGFGTPNGRQSALGSRTPAHLAATPYHHQQDGGPYRPNQIDPLDVEISRIVNAQPLYVRCQRLDLPLNKAEAAIQKPTDRIANYAFGFSDRPVTCKLVERGPQRERKVLAKVGGGESSLSSFPSLIGEKAEADSVFVSVLMRHRLAGPHGTPSELPSRLLKVDAVLEYYTSPT